MQVKEDKGERVAIFVAPKYRDMLNKVAEANFRGQRLQAELLFQEAFKKIKKPL